MEVLFYRGDNSPVLKFIRKLPVDDRARIFACLKSMSELGFECPRSVFRQIRGKLWEVKIRTPHSGFRIFYVTVREQTCMLLHAYKKESSKAPQKEISIAEKRMMEVLNDEKIYVE